MQSKDIVKLCCSEEIAKTLFTLSLYPNRDISAAGLKILINLLEKEQMKFFIYQKLSCLPVFDENQPKDSINDNTFIDMITSQLKSFKAVLLEGAVNIAYNIY